jgi:hypothetical protein
MLTPAAKKQVAPSCRDKNRRIGDYEFPAGRMKSRAPRIRQALCRQRPLAFRGFDTFKRYDDDFELKPPTDGQDVVDQIVRWQKVLADKKPRRRSVSTRCASRPLRRRSAPALHCAFRCGDMGGNMIPVNSFKGHNYSFGPNTPMDYPPSITASG